MMEKFCFSEMKESADRTIAKVANKAKVLAEQIESRQDGKSILSFIFSFVLSGGLAVVLCIFLVNFWNRIDQIVGSPLVNVGALLSAILLLLSIVLKNILSLLYYKHIFAYRQEVESIRNSLMSHKKRLDGIYTEMVTTGSADHPIEVPSDVNARLDEIGASISSLEAISTKATNILCIILYFAASIIWTFYSAAFFYVPLRDLLTETISVVLPDADLSGISAGIGVIALISAALQCVPATWLLTYRKNNVDNLSMIALGCGFLTLWAATLLTVGLSFLIWMVVWLLYGIFWIMKWIVIGVVIVGVIAILNAIFSGG